MKKILVVMLVSVLFLSPMTVKAENVNLAPSAVSAILIEASTGDIIYEKNANERRSPASMTKMMSMLLFIENIEKGGMKWTDVITTSEYASSMGGSQIYLEVGEQMSVEDLLKGVSMASANDAAVALAERVAGTEENFVKMMNDRAKELGLKNTLFKNCTGLDTEGHFSSAHDMVMIAKELVKHKKILEFTGTYEDYIRANTENKFWLVNTNKLVRFYDIVDGLKTGYTDTAKFCLTATAKNNGVRFIATVMGEPSTDERNKEVRNMLDYGFNQYDVVTVVPKNKILGKAPVEKGVEHYVDVTLKEDLNMLKTKTSEKKKVRYEVELDKIKAPITKGEKVGTLYLTENKKIIKKVDVVSKKDVEETNLGLYYLENLKDIFRGAMTIS